MNIIEKYPEIEELDANKIKGDLRKFSPDTKHYLITKLDDLHELRCLMTVDNLSVTLIEVEVEDIIGGTGIIMVINSGSNEVFWVTKRLRTQYNILISDLQESYYLEYENGQYESIDKQINFYKQRIEWTAEYLNFKTRDQFSVTIENIQIITDKKALVTFLYENNSGTKQQLVQLVTQHDKQ